MKRFLIHVHNVDRLGNLPKLILIISSFQDFETTPNITDPTSSDATVDDISNSVSLNLRWTIHSFVFSFDDSDTPLAAVTGYVVHCTVRN